MELLRVPTEARVTETILPISFGMFRTLFGPCYVYGNPFILRSSIGRGLVQTWSKPYQTRSASSSRCCKSTARFGVADVECWHLSVDSQNPRWLCAQTCSKDVLGGTGTYWAYSKFLTNAVVTIINTPLSNCHGFRIWVTMYYVQELESFPDVLPVFFFIIACVQNSLLWFSSGPKTCDLARDTGWLWFGISKSGCSSPFLGI